MKDTECIYEDGFLDDFDPLNLSEDEREKLRQLYYLSREQKFEFAVSKSDSGFSALFTSREENAVSIPTDWYSNGIISLYHSHTNGTLFSEKDFTFLFSGQVDKIVLVNSFGFVFVAHIDNGIIPTLDEYSDAVAEIMSSVSEDLFTRCDFWEWSEEKKFYEREKEISYRIARHFKWKYEGGAL